MATARKRVSSIAEDDYFSFDRSPFMRPSSPAPSGRFSLRRSIQSSRASTVESSLAASSCVSSETSKEECHTQRFIVWAAVRRNACDSMSDDERRTCPLHRCGAQFTDHESMLRHLVECPYLSLCEYYCHDHEMVERFDDSKCKKCLGNPSRRKKMLYKAKNFFSSLGQKGKKGHGVEDASIFQATPSQSHVNTHELSTSTEIVEMDSGQIVADREPQDQDAEPFVDPQALVLPDLPELANASMFDSSGTRYPLDSAMAWQPTPIYDFVGVTADTVQYQNTVPSKPLLQVTTQGLHKGRKVAPTYTMMPPPAPRSKNLSPSSSVRSTTSTMSSISSIISPISAWSHDSNSWNPAFNTNTTSPNTDMLSFEDFLPCNTQNFLGVPTACQQTLPPTNPQDVFELPADSTFPTVDLSADPSAFSFDTNIFPSLSYDPNIVLNEDLGETIDLGPLVNTQPVEIGTSSSDGGSEAKILVTSTREMLAEHIASSQTKMQELTPDQLINELRTLSPQAITTIGLRTLRDMLDLQHPPRPVDAICVVHLVYAISLIEYDQDLSARAHQLFNQCLDYAQFFASSDRAAYLRLATAIWKPTTMSDSDLSKRMEKLSRSPSNNKGKHVEVTLKPNDRLVCTAQHFLDDLEMSTILKSTAPIPPEIQSSSLYMKHFHHDGEAPPNQGFDAIVELIIRNLKSTFNKTKNLDRKLNTVQQHVTSRTVRSVRRVELELLDAGRSCLPSTTFFDKYVPQVRELCDSLYRNHESTASQRTTYLKHGVALVEALMSEFISSAPLPATVITTDNVSPIDEFLTGFPDIVCTDTDALLSMPAVDLSTLNLGLDTNIQPVVTLDNDIFIPAPVATSSSSSSPSTSASPSSNTPFPSSTSTTASSVSPPAQPQPNNDNAHVQTKIESDSCCDICGYRPKGDPQWFKGSMARHMKKAHGSNEIFACRYPGCNSSYRNRQDNLKQHIKEKNHYWPVGAGENDTVGKHKKKKSRSRIHEEDEEDEADGLTVEGVIGERGGAERRPSKRKKISA